MVLIGHNMKRFDFPRLLMTYRAVNLEAEFTNACSGGIDSLPIFKDIHPGMESYKQQYLFETLLNKKYWAHNALDDVLSLKELYTFSNVPEAVTIKSSFSTEWGIKILTFRNMTESNAKTMVSLITKKVLSKQMVTKINEKIARSGLRYNHLVTVFQKDGKMV